MAKRRIVLSSQEMTELNNRIKLLESQLKRSNLRVEEMEKGVKALGKDVKASSADKDLKKALAASIKEIINPPVKARENREFEGEALAEA